MCVALDYHTTCSCVHIRTACAVVHLVTRNLSVMIKTTDFAPRSFDSGLLCRARMQTPRCSLANLKIVLTSKYHCLFVHVWHVCACLAQFATSGVRMTVAASATTTTAVPFYHHGFEERMQQLPCAIQGTSRPCKC